MTDARALVDRHVAWMAGPGRPSPQRADEDDGAAAGFHVDGILVAVFASHEGEVEIYALGERGITFWDYALEGDADLAPEDQAIVTATLTEMGKHVRFPAETWRTVWPES